MKLHNKKLIKKITLTAIHRVNLRKHNKREEEQQKQMNDYFISDYYKINTQNIEDFLLIIFCSFLFKNKK